MKQANVAEKFGRFWRTQNAVLTATTSDRDHTEIIVLPIHCDDGLVRPMGPC